MNIYLDDVRTPKEEGWIIVRDYYQFINKIQELGLENIRLISLDHDLGDKAMREYFNNVSKNYQLDYDNLEGEKTGYDCCKWLINYFYDKYPKRIQMDRTSKKSIPIRFPKIVVHSANPIGSGNMMGYINNFLMNEGMPQDCVRVEIPHTV